MAQFLWENNRKVVYPSAPGEDWLLPRNFGYFRTYFFTSIVNSAP